MNEFVKMIGAAFAYYTDRGITSMKIQQKRDKTYLVISFNKGDFKEVCVTDQDEFEILNSIYKAMS